MNIRIVLYLWLLLILFRSFPIFGETISLAIAAWPPYYSQQPPYGLHAQLLTKLLAPENIDINFVWYPDWKAAISTSRAGRHHGTPSWICTPENAQDFIITNPVFVDNIALMYLKDEPLEWHNLADLKSLGPFGVTKSYTYSLDFQHAIRRYNLKLHEVRKDELLFNLLLKKRVKAALFSEKNGKVLLSQLPPRKQQLFEFHPQPIAQSFFHILISKKAQGSKQLADKINRQIKAQAYLLAKVINKTNRFKLCPFLQEQH
ncbi:substrate-binding periplasmic protein [Zooshikella harenae]|uniref:Transporter substrate-binding domain-containing protein n=1 Tax=Zooshikella harenae TaxID=2827238 RepID=A0ABS5ZB79_9GAMM|nr:transporter substrate-binding domain-containing protein [Zooshikella harenae]MBU2711133.1 transporter substrate-binding domain-containing protein [Zooshikella harenae]